MKRVFTLMTVVAIAAMLFASCNGKSGVASENLRSVTYEDTVGFAQFQAWKMMNERVDPANYQQTQQPAQPVRTVYKTRTVNQSGSMSTGTQNQAKVKKGMSKSAKYAIIGGAAGGAAGAIINKKDRLKGGIIGAVLGAGGGYVLGRSQDKKDGRF